MNKILFVQTGGTIDKDYPHTTKGWAFEIGDPAVESLLEKLNPSFEYDIITAFKKDSLEIDANDREKLVTLISKSPHDRVVITHGTDTLIQTGQYLLAQIPNKTIVLTGAMRPAQFANTDAGLNVGGAIAATQVLSNGVYIAMHGIVKSVTDIQRDKATGKFY
ncbi:MAG: asparaginase [Cyclobacteriaceae bacterium]